MLLHKIDLNQFRPQTGASMDSLLAERSSVGSPSASLEFALTEWNQAKTLTFAPRLLNNLIFFSG